MVHSGGAEETADTLASIAEVSTILMEAPSTPR